LITPSRALPISFPDENKSFWDNGASIQSTKSEASCVFIRLPYIGFKGEYNKWPPEITEDDINPPATESLKLPEYSRLMAQSKEDAEEFQVKLAADYAGIWVHQAWFVILNEGMLKDCPGNIIS
jgi:hypothetical protein